LKAVQRLKGAYPVNKNVLTRVLAALGGVTLCGLALCALAETFFQAPVTASIGRLLGARTPLAVLLTLLLAIMLGAFGVSCLMMLSSKRAAKKAGFVMQKGENGVIGVAIKSIEGLVQTCIRQHDTVSSAEIAVVERRDGIVILLDIKEAAGVNIPLAVGALQKQIKQYVNERVNRYSKISEVVEEEQEFEKTATKKIRRFLYTGKGKKN
jgi:hypothetical protein